MSGREMLNILAERSFPADEVVALASRRSMGVEVSFGDRTLKCKALEHYDFRRRHLPDVGGRRGVEGMVAEDRGRRRGGDR
jgi:aspartate-semialdehyde dehydrogenase